MSTSKFDDVVNVEWLKGHLYDPNVRVVDIRWSLASSGRSAYEAGHVPGAAFVDLERDLTPESGPGRHPVPSRDEVARALGAIGIGDETHVIAYDDGAGSIASRVWFLLRHYGHEKVSILDGGYRAWAAANGPLSTEIPTYEPRALHLHDGPPGVIVDKRYVMSLGEKLKRGESLLLDARARERYRGETEPVDARPGHIPGAKSAPWSENAATNAAGVPELRSPRELREHYAALGAEKANEVIVYCGSSVTACLDFLGLVRAGFENVRVYEGSWSDWARDPSLPAAQGDE